MKIWLVVLTILKNMKVNGWWIISYMKWKIKMFETTNQKLYLTSNKWYEHGISPAISQQNMEQTWYSTIKHWDSTSNKVV
jgi:hypothetical protein